MALPMLCILTLLSWPPEAGAEDRHWLTKRFPATHESTVAFSTQGHWLTLAGPEFAPSNAISTDFGRSGSQAPLASSTHFTHSSVALTSSSPSLEDSATPSALTLTHDWAWLSSSLDIPLAVTSPGYTTKTSIRVPTSAHPTQSSIALTSSASSLQDSKLNVEPTPSPLTLTHDWAWLSSSLDIPLAVTSPRYTTKTSIRVPSSAHPTQSSIALTSSASSLQDSKLTVESTPSASSPPQPGHGKSSTLVNLPAVSSASSLTTTKFSPTSMRTVEGPTIVTTPPSGSSQRSQIFHSNITSFETSVSDLPHDWRLWTSSLDIPRPATSMFRTISGYDRPSTLGHLGHTIQIASTSSAEAITAEDRPGHGKSSTLVNSLVLSSASSLTTTKFSPTSMRTVEAPTIITTPPGGSSQRPQISHSNIATFETPVSDPPTSSASGDTTNSNIDSSSPTQKGVSAGIIGGTVIGTFGVGAAIAFVARWTRKRKAQSQPRRPPPPTSRFSDWS